MAAGDTTMRTTIHVVASGNEMLDGLCRMIMTHNDKDLADYFTKSTVQKLRRAADALEVALEKVNQMKVVPYANRET